jgi:hypothetical protein
MIEASKHSRRFLSRFGSILFIVAATLLWYAWTWNVGPDQQAVVQAPPDNNEHVSNEQASGVGEDEDASGLAGSGGDAPKVESRAIQPVSPYPIRQQPGIWPPELPEIPRPLPPPGATSVTAYLFIENDIFNPEPAKVQVDYLRMYARVNGQTVLVNSDDYGQAAGKRRTASGNWTPRSDMTDPSIEIAGVVADEWGADYFTTIPSLHADYATQIWNAKPGRVPAGATQIWAEARLLVSGSGLAHLGFDWYGPQGYIANGGFSGFQVFAAPSWQVVTFGK